MYLQTEDIDWGSVARVSPNAVKLNQKGRAARSSFVSSWATRVRERDKKENDLKGSERAAAS